MMKSFMRAVEIWRPAADGKSLVFADALYDGLDAFRAASIEMTFAYDEGLPGKAWAQRHPIVLKSFENSYFKRTAAAHASGLTCGIALPLFHGDVLRAVVVFFCGDDYDHVGAIELWRNDPLRWPGLRLADGHYGIAENFEWRGRNTEFMRGFGLPGEVWARRKPIFLPDLGASFRFLRADDARQVGINKGLGIPCPGDPDNVWVMVFLSALGTPIAQRFEIWKPSGEELIFQEGDCARSATHAADFAGATIKPGEGVIAAAWRDDEPKIVRNLAAEPSRAGESAAAVGLTTMIALPIYDDEAMRAVVTMYF